MNRVFEQWLRRFRGLSSGPLLKSLQTSGWDMSRRPQRLTAGVHREVIPRRCSGFSLLELMIVLVIMVGILAVVWPNLRKPLESSAVREAAQIVRDAIDSARYQAAIEGEITFVRLQAAGVEVTSGSFASFLSEPETDLGTFPSNALSDRNAGTSSGRRRGMGTSPQRPGASALAAGKQSSRPPRGWQLPTDVIVLDVQWTTTPHLPIAADAMPAGGSAGLETANRPTMLGSAITPTSPLMHGNGAEAQVWWLPFSPVGGGRDASIFLLDQRTRKTVSIRFESATGALEIVRE